MLKKLRLHNFRTYLNAEFSFTTLHLVVGKNNSGKTNLFYAMRMLNATAVADLSTALRAVPGGSWEMTNFSSKSNLVELSCTCVLEFHGVAHSYEYSLCLEVEEPHAPSSSPSAARIRSERLHVSSAAFGDVCLLESDGREAQMLHEGKYENSKTAERVTTLAPRDSTMLCKLYELDTNRRALQFRRFLGSWCFFNLAPEQMRLGWSEPTSDSSSLLVNGGNLANVIYNLKNLDERRYRSVIDEVCRVEPELKAVNFVPNPGQTPVPFLELRSRPRASWVGLSAGTLRCMALAYIAHSATAWRDQDRNCPTQVMFIEEPENGLYPGYLRTMFELFETRGEGTQFIFTSHSPYFINLFDNRRDSVTLLRRAVDRTEIVEVPDPNDDDPDRLLLAEQYSMELFD